jgi:competence protein ComEC
VSRRLTLHVPHVLLASLCLGVALANAARPSPAALVAAGCGLALAAAVLGGWRRVALVALTLALAGWWWGSLRLAAIDRSVLAGEIGRVAAARVVVTGPARRSRYALRVPARAVRFGETDVREPVQLQLPPERAPPQGAVLELTGQLVAPRGAEDGFDERTWLRRHGVHVVLRADSWRIVGHRGGVGGIADRIRSAIAAAVGSGVDGERRAVLLGVVLGEDEGIETGLRDDFRASGLYHLLAVSGQNVALVAGGALLLAWLLGIPRLVGELCALVAIVGYVLAVGAQPSVIRAGVAGVLASLAWICARERDRWWFLLLGALVLLAWNPYTLFDAGFQLSFAAVVAIFTLVAPLLRWLEGYPVPRALRGAAAVSAACGIATAPILLVQFGAVPVYSVLSNAIAAPVAAPLLGLGLLAAAVDPLFPDVATLLSWVDGWLAAYLALCARMVAALPYARLSTRPAAIVTAVAVAVLVMLRQARRHGHGGLVIAAVCLCACALVAWRIAPTGLPPPKPPTGLRVTFLDVGQGDATLVQGPAGALLVDEGPPDAHVEHQLDRLGVQSLALIVLTHPQTDHVGGARDVIAGTRVGLVLDPRQPTSVPAEQAALTEARARRVPVVTARLGMTYAMGRVRLRVLWPDGPGLSSQDPNDHAVVCIVSYGETDVLLTADAESNVLLPLRLPPVEVLKVSHHGSDDPLLPELLTRIRPHVAVISVGAGNSYGHPTPATLATLNTASGLLVYRTDRDGAVTVESDGRRISVATEH